MMSVGIIELLLIVAGLALLVRLRNRPLVVLLVLAIVGGVFLLARIETRTMVVADQHAHPEAWDATQAHLEEQRRLAAEHLAEVLKNQRLAAQMRDATVQHSPDGSILETYPDGMQIREYPWSSERQIIHEADSSLTFYTPYEGGGYQTRATFGFAVLLLPMLALFGLFMALRGRSRQREPIERKSSGAGWVAAGAASLLAGALFFVGSNRTTIVHQSPPPVVKHYSKVAAPPAAPVAPRAQTAVTTAIPQTVEDLQDEVEDRVGEFESLESLWEQLTAPRIKLVEETEKLTERSQQELADAARLVLRQSLPAADPFTQGWLTNAAKAIVHATKSTADQSREEAATQLVAAAHAQAEAPAAEAVTAEMPLETAEARLSSTEPVATADASRQSQLSAGRPDWVNLPPQATGGVFQMVVSTDEFAAVEECRTQLENRLRYAVADRVRSVVSEATGRPVTSGPMLADMGVDADYIRRVLCVADYEETSSDGRTKIYALLQFNPQQEAQLIERWHAAKRGERLGPMYPTVAAKVDAKSYITGERPGWIDQPPKLVGNTRRVVVSTDPFSTVDECYVQLEERLRYAVADRVRQLAEQATGRPVGSGPSLDELGVRSDYIFRELCPEPDYVETVKASFGDMQRAHALLEYSPQQDQFLLERWRGAMRTERVGSVAALGACLLGGLASIFGLLKVDTWTRGYYTKRLFIGVPAAIIGGLIAIAAIFA